MKKRAKFLLDVSDNFSGRAELYSVEPPLEGHRHVVVSAVEAPFTGPETYIFGADSKGKVKQWGELDGSYRGGLEIGRALRNAGYSVEK